MASLFIKFKIVMFRNGIFDWWTSVQNELLIVNVKISIRTNIIDKLYLERPSLYISMWRNVKGGVSSISPNFWNEFLQSIFPYKNSITLFADPQTFSQIPPIRSSSPEINVYWPPCPFYPIIDFPIVWNGRWDIWTWKRILYGGMDVTMKADIYTWGF